MSVPPSPFGQNPYSGSPAGQTPGAGSEPRSTRPSLPNSIAMATELWILVIVAQCVIYGSQYSQFVDSFDDFTKDQPDIQIADWMMWASFGAGGAVIAAFCGGIAWLARMGYNWARLVLGFFSFYLVVNMVTAFFADGSDSWVMIPNVVSGVAALGAGVLLMHRDSDTYCKDSARRRKQKKQQPPSYYNTGYPQQPFYGPPQQYGQDQSYGQQLDHGRQTQYGGEPGYPPAGYQPPAGPGNHTSEDNRPEPGDRT